MLKSKEEIKASVQRTIYMDAEEVKRKRLLEQYDQADPNFVINEESEDDSSSSSDGEGEGEKDQQQQLEEEDKEQQEEEGAESSQDFQFTGSALAGSAEPMKAMLMNQD